MRSPFRALLLTSTLVAGLVVSAGPAAATHDVQPARVAGENRMETAAEVARLQYDTANTVILAAQSTFPDALASAPLAGELQAPVLLTPQDDLPPATIQALEDLETSAVTIVGGSAAVSLEVENDLQDRGYAVDRIAGETRFETAAQIAAAVQDAQDNAANFPGDVRAAFLANGFRFPDALTAGAPAAHGPAQIPIALTTEDTLPPSTVDFLDAYDIETVFVVGGSAVINPDVVDDLESRGYNVERIAGTNRMQTATEMADFAIEFLDFDANNPAIARGDVFADALAISPFQGAQDSPLLLTASPTVLSEPTENWLAAACPEVQIVRAVGGVAAITQDTLDHAEQAAQSCHATPPSEDVKQDYVVAPQQPLTSEPGTAVEFSTGARYDDAAFADSLDVALFPCNQVDVTGAGEPVFDDGDEDGFADGIFTTNTGEASIISVNGEVPEGGATNELEDVSPGTDGEITIMIDANANDCTIPVFYEDLNEDDQLSVNADENVIEPFGVGKVRFASA